MLPVQPRGRRIFCQKIAQGFRCHIRLVGQALIEARQSGVHPFCITIDREAKDYLPRLYGPASWTLVDDVRKLPLKSAEIYRRLTA